jgi:c-di-GMP-binding flagellar brake protein YcgR
MTEKKGAAKESEEERRRNARANVELFIQYRLIGGSYVDTTRDVSTGGVFLTTPHPLPLNSHLEVLLPDEERGESMVIQGKVVRVVWGGRAGDKKKPTGMAVEFEEIPPEKEARLIRILGLRDEKAAEDEKADSASGDPSTSD